MEAIWEAVTIVPVRGVNRGNESENREYFFLIPKDLVSAQKQAKLKDC